IATAVTTGLTPSPPATTSASTAGFSLGFSKPAASATPFALPITSASAGGLTLSSALTSTPAASTGFTLSSLSGTAAAATTAPAGLSLGGALTGLGGPLFQSASTATSGDKTGTRPEDSKALKDETLPAVICQDVDSLQKFVKEQKQVQEEISRMSSKAMLKVQEDIKALKQLLSLAASGLQRNTLSIDKLKIETAQELVLYPQSRELPIENRNIDSLSEGVIHLIKSKTFCSKKAFLGNKSNSE
ncbi:hypothetical protein E2I00_017686, partial [Balaenoptera physalus]